MTLINCSFIGLIDCDWPLQVAKGVRSGSRIACGKRRTGNQLGTNLQHDISQNVKRLMNELFWAVWAIQLKCLPRNSLESSDGLKSSHTSRVSADVRITARASGQFVKFNQKLQTNSCSGSKSLFELISLPRSCSKSFVFCAPSRSLSAQNH